MAEKLNSAGEMQSYDPKTGKYGQGSQDLTGRK